MSGNAGFLLWNLEFDFLEFFSSNFFPWHPGFDYSDRPPKSDNKQQAIFYFPRPHCKKSFPTFPLKIFLRNFTTYQFCITLWRNIVHSLKPICVWDQHP
jgi:hypothetical protein